MDFETDAKHMTLFTAAPASSRRLLSACMETYSRAVDPDKKAYLMRIKNMSVMWILNDQNSSKWSLEGCYGGSTAISTALQENSHLHFYILLLNHKRT